VFVNKLFVLAFTDGNKVIMVNVDKVLTQIAWC